MYRERLGENYILTNRFREMYTSKASYAIFEENIKGTLESGKLADVIILDQDILSVPQDSIDKIGVVATIKYGDLIYKKI